MCTQVITPGYRVILEANGREVEYHTDEAGTVIRPATILLTWKREGGIAGFCDTLVVYLSGEVHGSSCKSGQYVEKRLRDLLSENEIVQWEEWLTDYGMIEIDASDPEGRHVRRVLAVEDDPDVLDLGRIEVDLDDLRARLAAEKATKAPVTA